MIDNRIKGRYVLFISLNFLVLLALTNILAKQPYLMNTIYSFVIFLLVAYGFFLLNSSNLRRSFENLLIIVVNVGFITLFIYTTKGFFDQYVYLYSILLAYGAFDRGRTIFLTANLIGLALLLGWTIFNENYLFIFDTEVILGIVIYIVLVITIRKYSLNCINCTLTEECSRGDTCSLYKAKRSYKEFGVELNAKSFKEI